MRLQKIVRAGLGLAAMVWSSGLALVLPASTAHAAEEPATYLFGSPQAIRTLGLMGDELEQKLTEQLEQYRASRTEGATINGQTSTTPPNVTETLIENLDDGAGGDTWNGTTVQASDETGRLYVAWRDSRNGGVGTGSIYVKSSQDGGATWSSEKRLDKSSGTGDADFSLNITTGGRGDVYVVWGDDRDSVGAERLFFTRSLDAGATWSTAVELDAASDLAGLPSSVVADGQGHVVVVWEDVRGTATDIYAVRSSDFGETWSDEVRINDVTGANFEVGPIAVLGKTNDISVFWQSDRAGTSGEDLMAARSTDGGATWAADVRINTNAAGSLDLDNWDASSDGNGGVHAFYTMSGAGAFNDSVTAYARSSTDFGKTYGGQKKLSDGFEVEETTFAFIFLFAGPIMGNATFDGTNHRAVFAYDGGPAPGATFGDAMVTTTSDGGATWSTSEKVDSDPTGTGGIGQIVADINNEGQVLVAYDDTRFGGGDDLFMNYSDDYGATWQTSDTKVSTAAAGTHGVTVTGAYFFFVTNPSVEGGNNDNRSNFYITFYDNRTDAPGMYLGEVTFQNNDEGLVRLAGADRIKTGIEISKDSYPANNSVGALVVARSDNYPDALAAGPLANMLGGPVLLTPSNSLDGEVAAEIVRLFDGTQDDATDVYIAGGTAAISSGVEAAIAALNPKIDVQRLGGANRIGTAILIAQTMDTLRGRAPSSVFITTSQNFPDALAASAPAGDTGISADLSPILLTPRTSLDSTVAAYLTGNSATTTTAYLIGGTAAINDAVLAATDTIITSVQRLAGANRYGTAVAVASKFYTGDQAPLSMGIATGLNFPDALTGGAHSGNKHQPLVLVRTSDVPSETSAWITDNAGTLYAGYIYGGTAAVDNAVKAYAESIL